MAGKSFRLIFANIALAAVALVTTRAGAQSVSANSTASASEKPKMTEEAFKNIQVLKGIPADELIAAMQFITASLGVECDFCHQEGAFDKDDKKPKQTARKMMQMMFAINKDNFDGHRELTCYSCHRGAPRPVAIPIISEVEHKPVTAEAIEETPANAASLPDANKIIEKYVRSVGGAEAIQKISSRIQKGTVNFGGHKFALDVFTRAPDKRVSVMHLPNGDSVTAYDGHDGWLAAPGRPVREMSGADRDAAKLDADLHFPMDATNIFSDLSVERTEKFGDHEVYVVSGLREGQPPVKLYFDEQSGLLLRLVRYAESPLGRNPTQIDYSDYRDTGGVKIPFQWTISRPGGRFTIQVEQMQQNVPIEPTKFTKPAETPAPEQKPPPQ
jgi:photosynthetic reaction center cytochrome c subunit